MAAMQKALQGAPAKNRDWRTFGVEMDAMQKGLQGASAKPPP